MHSATRRAKLAAADLIPSLDPRFYLRGSRRVLNAHVFQGLALNDRHLRAQTVKRHWWRQLGTRAVIPDASGTLSRMIANNRGPSIGCYFFKHGSTCLHRP